MRRRGSGKVAIIGHYLGELVFQVKAERRRIENEKQVPHTTDCHRRTREKKRWYEDRDDGDKFDSESDSPSKRASADKLAGKTVNNTGSVKKNREVIKRM